MKKHELQSFDFSTIGEEQQIILDIPEQKEQTLEEQTIVEAQNEPSKTEEFDKNYFSSDYLRSIFEKEMSDKIISGKNISVDAYLNMAYNDLKVVGQMDKRIQSKRDGKSQILSVVITMIKWLKSIRGYVNMASELSKFHNSNVDLSLIDKNLEEAISQRENLKSEIESKISGIKYAGA